MSHIEYNERITTMDNNWRKYQSTTHKRDELAYLDTFEGMIPCKIVSIYRGANSNYNRVYGKVQITANRGAYKRGEVIDGLNPSQIVPRQKIVHHLGITSIINSYTWVVDCD